MNPGPYSRHAYLGAELAAAIRPPAKARRLRQLHEFNIGEPNDYRVPDLGLLQPGQPDGVYLPTAALVVEVVSPGDESWLKFDFYAAHDVDEVAIVDGETDTVHWFALRGDAYERVDRSGLLDLSVAEVTEAIDWS